MNTHHESTTFERFVVGHQTRDVSDNHYRRVGDRLEAEIKTLPVPAEFRAILNRDK